MADMKVSVRLGRKTGLNSFVNALGQILVIPSTSWLLFDVNKVDAKKGQTVEITVTASGKGNVDIGFYEYKNGFNVAGLNVKKLALTDKAQEQKIVIPIKYADTTLFRPVFRLASDSQVVVSKYALTVVKSAK